jgi:hypothetical protein
MINDRRKKAWYATYGNTLVSPVSVSEVAQCIDFATAFFHRM